MVRILVASLLSFLPAVPFSTYRHHTRAYGAAKSAISERCADSLRVYHCDKVLRRVTAS